jgi:hypothetical protein
MLCCLLLADACGAHLTARLKCLLVNVLAAAAPFFCIHTEALTRLQEEGSTDASNTGGISADALARLEEERLAREEQHTAELAQLQEGHAAAVAALQQQVCVRRLL